MPGTWTKDFSFIKGAVRRRDLVYLILSGDEMAANKTPHSFIVEWNKGAWNKGGKVDWRTAGVAIAQHPLQQMAAIGEFGQALLLGSRDRHEETIGTGPDSPQRRGPLRGVRTIGQRVYVAGMDRQVYRRDGQNTWTSIDQGARPSADSQQVTGFEALDGFSESDIYAVGWDGEIWQSDGQLWRPLNSPTNLVLTAVCCAGDGQVYACGRRGLLIRGRAESWEVIEHENTQDDFWDLAWYNQQLYLSTTASLFTLQKDDHLALVDMGEDQASTCYGLSAADGVLWSIGPKDVMAFDGRAWTRID